MILDALQKIVYHKVPLTREEARAVMGEILKGEATDADYRTVEIYVTPFHELEHFHDSFLNPMLLSLYGLNISENYLRWRIIEAICVSLGWDIGARFDWEDA